MIDRFVSDVLELYGLELRQVGRDMSFVCPVCAKEERHRTDGGRGRRKRLSAKVTTNGLGWNCFDQNCGASGSGLSLLALLKYGELPAKGDSRWKEAIDSFDLGVASLGKRTNKPEALPPRPLPTELQLLWHLGMPPSVGKALGGERARAAEYLESRGIDIGLLSDCEPDLCRILPPSMEHRPPWWLEDWLKEWNIASPMVRADGLMVGIQARTWTDKQPKSRYPLACYSGGTVFANSHGRQLLRRYGHAPSVVVFVEGLTDTLKVSLALHRRGVAVFGWVAGSSTFLWERCPGGWSFPWSASLYILATDNDVTGNAYAAEILEHIPAGKPVHRARAGIGTDWAKLSLGAVESGILGAMVEVVR